MPKANKDLGKRVKEFRITREMTQGQAADFFRVSMSTYVRIERGAGCSDLTRGKIERPLTTQQQAVA